MLTLDIGNSRIKWALWDDRRITRSGAIAYSVEDPAQAFAQLGKLEVQQPVVVACVAGEAVEPAQEGSLHTAGIAVIDPNGVGVKDIFPGRTGHGDSLS